MPLMPANLAKKVAAEVNIAMDVDIELRSLLDQLAALRARELAGLRES